MSAPTPALVRARVVHRRTRPVDYAFEHRTTSWLVDAREPNAAFPRWLAPLARIRAEDHLGSAGSDLMAKVHRLLAEQDLQWSAHLVQVLTNARSWGYVFDPLTTWFCFDAAGRLEGILAEVHNTYGERHVYPLVAADPDTDPRPPGGPGGGPSATRLRQGTLKEFYVSPFFAVEGRYDIRARLSDHDVAVSITLTQDGQKVFTGTVHGDLVPATRRVVLAALARRPLASQRVAALIRWHGIRLWLRRLPVIPRRPHRATRGMQ